MLEKEDIAKAKPAALVVVVRLKTLEFLVFDLKYVIKTLLTS